MTLNESQFDDSTGKSKKQPLSSLIEQDKDIINQMSSRWVQLMFTMISFVS